MTAHTVTSHAVDDRIAGIAAAVHGELRHRRAGAMVRLGKDAVVVTGPASAPLSPVIAAAVDDDAGAGRVLGYAAAYARALLVPLRAVHVWTGRDIPVRRMRMPRQEQAGDADRLLSDLLYDHLPCVEAADAEREILHDADPAAALYALSNRVGFLVVAARPEPAGRLLGDTVRELVGRAGCPLAIVPARAGRPATLTRPLGVPPASPAV